MDIIYVANLPTEKTLPVSASVKNTKGVELGTLQSLSPSLLLTHPKSIKVISMRNLTATLCLTIAVLLGSAGMGKSADFKNCEQEYKKENYAAAIRLCRLFAEQGNPLAQHKMGWMYKNGHGVPINHKTAVKWYRLAAKKGYANAQYNLGNMYLRGQGVPQNYRTAVKWYKLAAEQGHAPAQSNLGVLYAMGRGVIQDNVYAYMWGNLAASNGNEGGGRLRDIIGKVLTPADTSKAQDLARECTRKKYKGC